MKSTELNDRKVDDKQRGEDFIRAKVNDILTVKQTEEDIESIKLELMVDIGFHFLVL